MIEDARPGPREAIAWPMEVTGMKRRPSWISRKRVSSVLPEPLAPAPENAGPEPLAPDAGVVQPAPAVHLADVTMSLALQRAADENATLRARIGEMASKMASLRGEILEASEQELVKLALAIAERVVGRELTTDPALVVEWAREGIRSLAAREHVVIAVSPDVGDRVPAVAWHEIEDVQVKADAALQPGTIEVRSGNGVVVTGASARLEAVAEALGASEP